MNVKKILMGGVLMTASITAFAGSSYTGHVQVHCNDQSGHCNLFVGTGVAGSPSCAGDPNWYVFNMNSVVWKQQFALAMLAQATQKNVQITGAGTCNIRPGVHEDIASITLQDN